MFVYTTRTKEQKKQKKTKNGQKKPYMWLVNAPFKRLLGAHVDTAFESILKMTKPTTSSQSLCLDDNIHTS
jgi:hypothetical protein